MPTFSIVNHKGKANNSQEPDTYSFFFLIIKRTLCWDIIPNVSIIPAPPKEWEELCTEIYQMCRLYPHQVKNEKNFKPSFRAKFLLITFSPPLPKFIYVKFHIKCVVKVRPLPKKIYIEFHKFVNRVWFIVRCEDPIKNYVIYNVPFSM